MNSFYKTLLLALLLPAFSFGQNKYKRGYVVNLKGDTSHGFIHYRKWNTNPRIINFKTVANNNITQKFTTKDIKFFTVGKLSFEKYSGFISTNIPDIDRLSEDRDTSYRMDTVFLQILQKGKNVAFYSYSDNVKTRFYIGEEPDYAPIELRYIYGESHKAFNRIYRNQLLALSDKYRVLNDDLMKTILKAGYSKNDIIHIISKINGLNKGSVKQKKEKGGRAYYWLFG